MNPPLSLLVRTVTAIAAGAVTTTTFAGSPIETPPKQTTSADGALTFGYQGSDEIHTGYTDLLQPLFSGDHAVLSYDGRFSFDDSDQDVQSHGLVFRYRVPDRDVILGANVYYDSVDSRHDHHFDQFGFGIEALTKWVDFRANYYLPDQKRERVDQRRDILVKPPREEIVPAHHNVGGSVQGPYVVRYEPFLQFSPSSFQRRELTQFESPLEGLDTELGFLIPGLNRYAEVRVFGGYYHFLNPFGSDFEGFKARLEARIRRGLIAEVEYWDDKSLTGGHWTGGVRVSLPFNLGLIFAGRNPFEGASEAFGPPSDDFGDRMTDLVIRSHRVQTTTSGYQTTASETATSVRVRREDGRVVATPIFDKSGASSGDLIVASDPRVRVLDLYTAEIAAFKFDITVPQFLTQYQKGLLSLGDVPLF